MRSLNLIIICTVLYLIVFAAIAQAQLPQIQSGLNYLALSQNTDGTWGSETSTVETTSFTKAGVDALKSLNQTTGSAYTTATTWLQSQSPVSVDYQAQRIHALGLTDTSINALIPLLDQLKHAWGGDDGYETDNLDTAFALQAFNTANYTDQILIFSAINYLFSTQNPDGGWGFVQGDDSNIYVTAQVLSTLARFRTVYIVEPQLASAAAFLLSSQNPDGGFGAGSSTVYESALAFIALIESGQTRGLPLQNTLNYLTTTQSANGSWNDDPYSTALALRALAQVKPDLTITAANIAVSPNSPTVGDSLTVTATVGNIGLEAATGVVVRLLDNGASIGEQNILAINPGATVPATFVIAPLAAVGEHVLTVAIDPANAINEVSKANNSATVRLWAKAPADLVVTPDFLTVTPAYPKPGESATLAFAVANMGESAAGSFSAIIYDGDPNAGGIQLGIVTIPGIAAGAWGEGSVSFTPASVGVHTLTLVVDPQHTITETSTANNTAQKTITVNATSGTGFIDLAIPMNGIRLDPARPASGATVTVNLSAVNYGTEAATADLELFDGDPAAGGLLLYKAPVTLNAGETRNVAVPWQIPAGVRTLRAYIDRLNAVAERDKTNNSQALAVMADMVDIEVSASDIAIAPEHPMAGDPATVKVTVQNRGIKATGPFTVNLYNGDPTSGGTLLQTFAVSDLAGDASQVLAYPFTAARGTYRFQAVCDPDNRITELYEDNNTAIRSLLVKTSAEAKGPDLVPLEFDLSGATTDPQSLRISGTARVKFQNKGDDKVATPFRITVFEDKDGDGVYTEGTDLSLGWWDYSAPMNPNMVGVVTINLAGTLTFRDAPIYAMVDSGQSVFEQNETNNSIRKGSACEARPAKPIEPVVKWKWISPAGAIQVPPVVMNLTDHNGDGVIDNRDVPDIVFGYYNNVYSTITALRGDTGAAVFSISDSNHPVSVYPFIAAGDIDGDGLPEIITNRDSNYGLTGLIAYGHDGKLKWDNTQQVKDYNTKNPNAPVTIFQSGTPVIADINADGKPAIIMGASVINADGSIRWVAKDFAWPIYIGVGRTTMGIYHSVVADLDMDGKSEIIAGNTVYNSDGTTKWWNKSLYDGNNAIVNFNDDPYPEIVLITHTNGPSYYARVYLLDHNGNVIWGPIYAKDFEPAAASGTNGPLVVADFDGDGEPEIGLRGIDKYFILDRNGKLKTTLSMPYAEENIGPSPTVFDLNGDGRPEVIFNGAYFRVYDGKDGRLLYKEKTGYGQSYQNTIVADVDGDNHAEIVAVGSNNNGFGGSLRVYGAKNNDWVGTRRIWNEPSYHVTNVNDDGTIPKYEAPSWLTNNNYRCNVPTTPTANPYLAADLSVSYVRVDMANYPNSVTITARIGNGGAKPVAPGVKTAFSDGDPANSGILIGSALTTKTLNPGDYEDVTITWNAPTEGSHTIQVTADADNTVPECDKGNNAMSLPVHITSGLPDLGVAAEDMVVPSVIPEGRLADIVVTVRNVGTLQANNVLVRLYSGNPATGGKQIGADQVIPAIAAGGSATVKTTWNTLGSQGSTWLYAVVDPAGTTPDTNRGNNTAVREVLVTPAVKPDLQLVADDIAISPSAPTEGETLTVTALVHNRGTQTANVKVTLYDGNPAAGGVKRGETVISQLIPMGGSAPATFTLDTVGLAGSRTLYLRIDPDNAIDESNEANNQASRTVTISPAGVQLGLTTDKGEYGANEAARITVTAANTRAEARNLAYDLQVLDKGGVPAATVAADTPLPMGANASIAFTAAWNTGATYSGPYTVTLRLKENGRTIAKASAPISILPVKTADARITADKLTYSANERVAITATITGTSPNYIFSDLSARTTVLDGAGEALFTETRTIATLTNGQRIDVKSYWNTGNRPKGAYTLKLELLEGTTPVTTTQSAFTIGGTTETGAGVTGAIAAQPTAIEAGTDESLSFSVTNKGNEDIASLTLTILIVDPDNGQTVRTLAAPAGGALAINATQTGSLSFSTTALPPRTLLAILQNGSQGTTRSIASTPFTVTDTTPPLLNLSALGDGAYTNNDTLNVAGVVRDNSGVKELKINGATVPVNSDGGFSHALILASGANTITTTATDLGGNRTSDTRTIILDQTAPVIVIAAPADNSKTGKGILAIGGTVDENAAVRATVNGVDQGVTMDGRNFTAMATLQSGLNTIEITATDMAGNLSSQKRSVLYDDQKPSLAITTPNQDIRTNQGSITVKGTATDPLTAVSVTVAKDNETYTPPVIDGTFEQAVTFSDEKSYPIVVTATNEVGTQVSAQRNIIYDITPPGLAISPVTTPISQNSQTVSGTREEGMAVAVTCATATVGEVSYPTATGWQAAIAGLKEGENVITANSSDAAGNVAQAATTIVLATRPPEITVTATPNLIWPPNHRMVPVTVGGGIDPHGADIQSVSITVSDEYGRYNYGNLAFGGTVLLEAWRDGTDMDGRRYTVTVVVTDRWGKSTTKATTVIVPHDMGK